MIHFSLNGKPGKKLQMLCLGSHSDDIEIGCGGTILRLSAERPGSLFHWVVFSGSDMRKTEAERAARLFAGPKGLNGLILRSFPDGFMPSVAADVKAFFEELKLSVDPDLIFTHNRRDAHQDHRLIAELTWNTFRNHLILEYEIPKYDGDLGQPGLFVPVDKDICKKKVNYILNTFKSQREKRWFEENTFLSLMRLRGMECNSPSGYAEAFYCRKVVL